MEPICEKAMDLFKFERSIRSFLFLGVVFRVIASIDDPNVDQKIFYKNKVIKSYREIYV